MGLDGIGLVCAGISVLFFGSNFVVTKTVNTGNGEEERRGVGAAQLRWARTPARRGAHPLLRAAARRAAQQCCYAQAQLDSRLPRAHPRATPRLQASSSST